MEAPTIWFESEAAATVGGMPSMINSGVIKKPPPTPNIPGKDAHDAAQPQNGDNIDRITGDW